MSLIHRAVMVARSNLNTPATQNKAAFSSPSLQERITDLKKCICDLALEYAHLNLVHAEQTTEAERYYKRAQEAMKSNNENLARTLLTQRHEVRRAATKLKIRQEYIEQTLATLSATLAKLEPMAKDFLVNPNEPEALRCDTCEHPLAVETFKDDDEALKALRAQLDTY